MVVNSQIFKTLQENDLFIFPLHTITENGTCSCGNLDCNSPGKHPFFKYNWKVIATNNKTKIKKWCSDHNELNWAIATGRKSSVTNKYLIVVDVDSRDHKILETIPKTFGYTTGNGYHFWFWSDVPLKSSVSMLAEKIDIRATNGYVVIPPSKHVSGKKYQFINGTSCEILDIPPEFKQGIQETQEQTTLKKKKLQEKNKETKTSSFYILENIPVASVRRIIDNEYKIPEGTRNKILFRLLCSDRAKGSSSIELKLNIQEYKSKCENPETLSDKELDILVGSASKYPPFRNLSREEPKAINTEFFNKFYIKSKTHWVSLKIIAEHYHSMYNETLDLYSAANYLKQQGFEKRRVSKGNVWGIMKNVTLDKV
jgi:hypothetical protein